MFKLYWNKDYTVTKSIIELRETITKLMNNLYDRNSRHKYSTDDIWLSDELSFKSDIESLLDERINQILSNIPFVLSFEQRLLLFYHFIQLEKETIQNPMEPIRVSIRRDFVFEDGFSKLNNLDSKLKQVIRVELISSNGLAEAGIDGGGVFKEFFSELIKTAYNSEYGLFKETVDHYLYPNPSSSKFIYEDKRQFEFLGKLLGKAIYENILVELPFSNFFLAKLLGKYNYVNDLLFLDSELHRNIMKLRRMTSNEIDELSLTFTTTQETIMENKIEIIELIPNGKETLVTNENKIKYIALLTDYKLNKSIKIQSQAFLNGLQQIVPPHLLKMFNQFELQTLISGKSGGIDIDNLRQYCVYSGGYYADHPVILKFWNVLSKFTPQEQHQFLMFVTSCSRPPLLGFKSLHPSFCIHQSLPSNGSPDNYLPTASTCMNFFKLPPYSSEIIMIQKIKYAINSKAGFELS